MTDVYSRVALEAVMAARISIMGSNAVWLDTDVPEEHTASIFRAEMLKMEV
jgi:hypothetical protein